MTPMPPAAEKIAALIRAQVPRPAELPETWGALRFDRRCPMGLLPGARQRLPAYEEDFCVGRAPGTDDEIKAFAYWWDRQHDAAEAVDAVWGEADADADTDQERWEMPCILCGLLPSECRCPSIGQT